MNVGVLAARTEVAQERTLRAAAALAARFGLEAEHAALLAATHKDRDAAVLFQREAIAALLEALVDVAGAAASVPEPADSRAAAGTGPTPARPAAAPSSLPSPVRATGHSSGRPHRAGPARGRR